MRVGTVFCSKLMCVTIQRSARSLQRVNIAHERCTYYKEDMTFLYYNKIERKQVGLKLSKARFLKPLFLNIDSNLYSAICGVSDYYFYFFRMNYLHYFVNSFN